MTTSIDEERERLLPRIERDQRDLAGAVNDLQTASAESGRRAVIWLGAVVMPIIAARFGYGARRKRILLVSTTPETSLENLTQNKTSLSALLNAFRAPAAPPSMGSAITESLFTLGAGVLLGTAIGLLLAPKTGVEMRRDLARRFNLDSSDDSDEVNEDAAPPGPTQIAP